MKRSINFISALLFVLFLASCEDEPGEISASLEGTWVSEKADFNFDAEGPLPGYTVTESDSRIVVEFARNGVVRLTDKNGVTTEGTYTLNDRKLALQIDYEIEDFSLSGTYIVDELTDSKLRTVIKKEDKFRDEDENIELDGVITVTLYFDRVMTE